MTVPDAGIPRTPGSAAGHAAPALHSGSSVFALLADGSTVEIRPAGPRDADAVRQMHESMSADNQYLRFFSLSLQSAAREAQRVCRDTGTGHGALLAFAGGRLAGVASYEPTWTPGIAEVAFAVPDDMHGHGVATLLLEHLVSLARLRGLAAFTATVLLDNAAMLRVFADAGLPVRRKFDDGVVELTFPLPGGAADPGTSVYLESVARRESRADVASLRHLLQPRSVAVAGASRRPGTVGRAILHNIVAGGFAGPVYAVNPRAGRIEGVRCAASVEDLPEVPELVIIAVPGPAVPEVAEACGRRGVRALTVITSGLGAGGADLLAICRRYGMRLAGPNCLGIMVPGSGLNATFAAGQAAAGVAGLVVQSGGVGIALLEHLTRLGIGVSSFASVGDKYDVSSNDMLMWWEQDGLTRMAVLYVESFGSPRKFARTARRIGRQMPVLTVIGGRSAAGQSAAASHTAAAATPLVTREALFAQAGVIAVTSLGGRARRDGGAARLPAAAGGPPGGGRLERGRRRGPGRRRMRRQWPGGGDAQRRDPGGLRALLPAGAEVAGPVDTTAAVTADAFRSCLEQVAADSNVDAVIAVTVPTAVCRPGRRGHDRRAEQARRGGPARSGRIGAAAAARAGGEPAAGPAGGQRGARPWRGWLSPDTRVARLWLS